MSETTEIKAISQQLDKQLRDLGLDAERPILEHCFSLAIAAGGLKERDFVREEGVSYNPRPARVCYILSNNIGNTEGRSLAAAMLAAVCENEISQYQDPHLPTDVLALAGAAMQPVEALKQTMTLPEAAQIALAVRLDRARHFHLSDADTTSWCNFLEETKEYLPLANAHAPQMETLLLTWLRRFADKYSVAL